VARRTLGALALVEGWRLLRHPATLAGLAISVWWLAIDGRGLLPVLDRADVSTAGAVLPLAGGVFLAANLATLRSRRHGTEELYDAAPAAPATRTGAHLAGLAGVVALGVVLVAAKLGWLAANAGVNTPSLAEAAVGPAVVALAGVLGVLAARWAPSPVVGPVALLALIVLQFLRVDWLTGHESLPGYLWLRPWHEQQLAREVSFRPAGWHLVYLAALTGLLVVVALARHGRSPKRLLAGGLALLVLAGSAWAQARPAPAATAATIVQTVEHPQAIQACQQRGTVRYCYFPAYRPWLAGWATAVEPVLARLPAAARSRPVEVRQDIGELWQLGGLSQRTTSRLLSGRRWHVPGVIPVGMTWRTGRAGEADAAQLALRAAAWTVGLPQEFSSPDQVGGVCDTNGQARGVIALWLAAQARPGAAENLRAIFAAPPTAPDAQRYFVETLGGSYLLGRAPPPWLWSKTDGTYAVELLDRPADQVAAALAPHWDRLTDPATPTAELVSALGLRPVPAPPLPPQGTGEHPGWQPPPCR
jgi:hypothetical protein